MLRQASGPVYEGNAERTSWSDTSAKDGFGDVQERARDAFVLTVRRAQQVSVVKVELSRGSHNAGHCQYYARDLKSRHYYMKEVSNERPGTTLGA